MSNDDDDDDPVSADDIIGDNDYDWDDIVIDSQSNSTFELNASNDIRFIMPDGTIVIKLCADGEIEVRGKKVENDKKVVQAMREFLTGLNPNYKDDSKEKENTIFPERMCFNVEHFRTRRNNKRSK